MGVSLWDFSFGHFTDVPFWLGPACTRLDVYQALFVETKLLRICHIQITTKRTLFVTNNLHLANSIYKQRDPGNHKAVLFIVGTAVYYDALIAPCHRGRNETNWNANQYQIYLVPGIIVLCRS